VAGCEDLTTCRLFEQPLQRRVATAPQVRRDAHPVEVHVDGEGGWSGVVGEPALLVNHLRERAAVAAKLHGNVEHEIPGLP
jgi:hypothetical protein